MRGSIEVELLKYADLSEWNPKVGDVIFRDGFIFRWFAVICGINGDILLTRKSGNLRLLMQGDYEEISLNLRKIKNSMLGSFSIISNNNIYYV
jgi:hypothetical protein